MRYLSLKKDTSNFLPKVIVQQRIHTPITNQNLVGTPLAVLKFYCKKKELGDYFLVFTWLHVMPGPPAAVQWIVHCTLDEVQLSNKLEMVLFM